MKDKTPTRNTVEVVNLLKLITEAVSQELSIRNNYLTDKQRIDLFLFLEDIPVNLLLLMYRLSDYNQLFQHLQLLPIEAEDNEV